MWKKSKPDDSGTGLRLGEGGGKKLIIWVAIIGAILFFAALALRASDPGLSTVTDFLSIHTVLEVFSVAVCFAIFGLRISAHRFTREFQSLYIGAAFFSVGFFQLMHFLTYQGMPDFSGPSSMNRADYFWVFARITFPAIIFAATTFPRRDYSRTQLWSLLLWLPFTIGVIAVDVAHLEPLPTLYEAGSGATPLLMGFEVAIIALLLLAILSVWRWDRSIREKGSAYIIGALVLGIFAEISMVVYSGPYDAFALVGHVFGFASFVLIFLALFRRSIETPYWKLEETKRVVEKTNVELNIEKNRSDRYFDFLAHDIANILAPVMSYGVMISSHPTAPGDIRKYARKIVDQTDRAAKFITNMRRLSEAEKVSAIAPPSYDLGANLKSIEDRFRKEHAKKRISFKANAPADVPIIVAGGEYVEDILFSILSNSAKHTMADEARIALMIEPQVDESGKAFWRISIDDEGPGMVDMQKLSIANPFDTSQRFARGVGSTISFMSAIAKHFGGKLWIEDRVPGTRAKGTRVIVTLPSIAPPKSS